MNKVYLCTEHNEHFLTLLQQRPLPNLTVTSSPNEANIVLGAPPIVAPRLHEFSQLEWLQSSYAGVEALLGGTMRADYQLTNVKGIFGQLISEYVIGYTIQHFRHFTCYQKQQNCREWRPHRYQPLTGKRMLVLGTGSIGQHLAHTASAIGLQVFGVNRTGIPINESSFKDYYHIEELRCAASNSDIIVNTLPATPDTKGLIDLSVLRACQGALLFNVGRGSTIDEPALLTYLEDGNIQHAFLDVFDQEPLPAEHPLWSHRSVTVTPHIAATSFPEQVFEIFRDNYTRWHQGFSLNFLVDFDHGY